MKRFFSTLPVLGTLAFIATYFWASALYPGGTKFNHAAIGYDHLYNFWCDLLEPLSYSGKPNLGYSIALPATIGLCTSMVFLWHFITELFPDKKIKCHIVRIAGGISMLLSIFVFSKSHDFFVIAAAFFGIVAFTTVIWGLIEKKEFLLVWITIITLLSVILALLLWQIQILPLWVPISQKTAFVLFFLWVWVVVLKYLKVEKRQSLKETAS